MSTSRDPETADAIRTPERRYQVRHKRILVVEDDRLSLIVLRQLLTAEGYKILHSSEGLGWDQPCPCIVKPVHGCPHSAHDRAHRVAGRGEPQYIL